MNNLLRIFWGRANVSRVGIACKHVLPNISADPTRRGLCWRLTHTIQVFRTLERASWGPTLSLWVRALGAHHVFPQKSVSGEDGASLSLGHRFFREPVQLPLSTSVVSTGHHRGFRWEPPELGVRSALQPR